MSLPAAAREFAQRWPHAVFQTGDGAMFDSINAVPLETIAELFIYADEQALHSWDAMGATEQNLETMVQLLVTDGKLTIIC